MSLAEIWTLAYSGVYGAPVTPVEQTLADWGITGCAIRRRSQAADECELTLDGMAFDATEIFPYKGQIQIKRDGVVWFAGTVTQLPKTASPKSERARYVVSGPWWWLEQIVYQTNWYLFPADGGVTAVLGESSKVILFANYEGALIETGAQITAAMEYALGVSLPLQLGTVGVSMMVPDEAGSDLTIAEVFKRALRWHPDAVTWVDYTTSPPTLNIAPRASLGARSFGCAGAPCKAFEITPRPDLQRPVVAIHYRQVNSYNGQQQLYETIEKYPTDQPELQPGALVATVELGGDRYNWVEMDIVAATFDKTSLDWWKGKCPQLADARVHNLALVGGSAAVKNVDPGNSDNGAPDDDPTYASELTVGSVADWMPIDSAETLVTAQFTYDIYSVDANGNAVVQHVQEQAMSVKIVTTNGATGPYRSVPSELLGDPKPTGLAEAFYNTLQQLQFEGEFTLAEAEVGDSGGPWPGGVLNLTGGRSEWAAMDAVIVEVRENIASGETTLRIGPHQYLSAADIVAHLRAARDRVIPALIEMATGVLSSGGAAILPGQHRKENSSGGAKGKGGPSWDRYFGNSGGNPPSSGNKIVFSPMTDDGSISSGDFAEDQTVQLSQVYVVNNGDVQQVLTHRSGVF